MLFFRKSLAFIQREFFHETSYKFAFSMELFSTLASVLTWFFLAKMFENTIVSYLQPYGGNYFAFVLIGIAFFDYLRTALRSLSHHIREGQTTGTLEALLVTQTGIPTIILCSSLYSFINSTFKVVVFLSFGAFAFGVNMGHANFPAACLILCLTIISFYSIGIISASFIIVIKRGDPMNWIFTALSQFLGGVYYPITVLPNWVRKFSYILPLTHSLESMRLALLKGYSLKGLAPNIVALGIFSIVMLPLSVLAFRYAVKRAKADGSLTHY